MWRTRWRVTRASDWSVGSKSEEDVAPGEGEGS